MVQQIGMQIESGAVAVMQGGAHADSFDQDKATAFVDALSSFDKRMNQVVVDSGILKGVPEGRLTSAGRAPSRVVMLPKHAPIN